MLVTAAAREYQLVGQYPLVRHGFAGQMLNHMHEPADRKEGTWVVTARTRR
jgi:hypothetical protein